MRVVGVGEAVLQGWDVLLLLGGGGVIKCERYGRRLGAGWGVLAALRQRVSTGRWLV